MVSVNGHLPFTSPRSNNCTLALKVHRQNCRQGFVSVPFSYSLAPALLNAVRRTETSGSVRLQIFPCCPLRR